MAQYLMRYMGLYSTSPSNNTEYDNGQQKQSDRYW